MFSLAAGESAAALTGVICITRVAVDAGGIFVGRIVAPRDALGVWLTVIAFGSRDDAEFGAQAAKSHIPSAKLMIVAVMIRL